MHFSTITALSAATLVSGAALKRQHLEDASNSIPSTQLLPALPLEVFAKTAGHMLTLEEALAGLNIADKMHEIGDKIGDGLKDGLHGLEGFLNPDTADTASTNEEEAKFSTMSVNAAAATCSNIRTRTEWDSTSTAERQNFVDSLKCLMTKPPSGQFPASKSLLCIRPSHPGFTATRSSCSGIGTFCGHGNKSFVTSAASPEPCRGSMRLSTLASSASLPSFQASGLVALVSAALA
jgi:hypothetical protein